MKGSNQNLLAGVKVLDFSALGPGPFASMMLADFGASVVSVSRPGGVVGPDPSKGMRRGKTQIELHIRSDNGRAVALQLAAKADVLIESNRPGVMERLGLGPDELLSHNPRLIYARLTGWGQSGPLARKAGHDINYLAVSGMLRVASGDALPPLAMLGDIANGSYQAVSSISMALVNRELNRQRPNGGGGVIDIAIADGASYMLQALFGEMESGLWDGDREHHILSGEAPFYTTYLCNCGGRFAVGAIEPKFYEEFLSVLGLSDVSRDPREQLNAANWPDLKKRISEIFRSKSRSEWTELFDEVDACCTPVLELEELVDHSHTMARGSVTSNVDLNLLQASPAPRFFGFETKAQGDDSDAKSILATFGLDSDQADRLLAGTS